MGGSRWNSEAYTSRSVLRADRGEAVMAYTHDVESGRAKREVHQSLNPHGVRVRESRDSEAHPESLAIAIILDETGSMRQVPLAVQRALPNLMNMLIDRNIVPHPQILFGAIGDATCHEVAPLQIGQFESGLEMEDCLRNVLFEGGGGGGLTESYELAAYFLARHTSLDCLEKRTTKGYCFFIGDEMPYDAVHKDQVHHLVNDGLQANVSTKKIFDELKEKYEVFILLPTGASKSDQPEVRAAWASLVGAENMITLGNANHVCETIAMTIAVCEGIDLNTSAEALRTAGADSSAVAAVTASIATVASFPRARRTVRV